MLLSQSRQPIREQIHDNSFQVSILTFGLKKKKKTPVGSMYRKIFVLFPPHISLLKRDGLM